MATKTALVLLASGAEEMEAVIAIDILRRAKIDVIVAGLDKDTVTCSRDVKIVPDRCLKDLTEQTFDVVVLPGGVEVQRCWQRYFKHIANFLYSIEVKTLVEQQNKAGNFIAAICAAPTALAAHGICKGKRVTSYPTFKEKFHDYQYSEERVVRDENLITSRGPGTAFEFALTIVDVLQGSSTVKQLSEQMLLA
ncbi:protein dj-1beta-like [Hydractinia symbiolongicarpus]|uniref:protein dj-1beta-like n=1 Tax=Hydractinia symbiolongicarpus TaxID=13093 RepID=UPI00254AA155|nr:protein dj-1beta-like [Hydractinia symbiolongicarpus]